MNANSNNSIRTVVTAVSGGANRALVVVFQRGHVWELSELPPRSIALDGAVRGPQIDTVNERYSFDHHDGCVRHATLSTCEQVFDALRVGLDPEGFTIYVNDWDGDTVLSLWLLLRRFEIGAVSDLVRTLGRLDALGPASGHRLPSGLLSAWKELYARDWRQKSDDQQMLIVQDALHVYAEYLMSDFEWRDNPAPKQIQIEKVTEDIYTASEPFGAFGQLYKEGVRFALLTSTLPDGTFMYTIGKQSEFVPGNIPAILAALREAEVAGNPAQSPQHNWGGASTIGGSPRNPDKSGSRLSPTAVQAIVDANR